MDSEFKVGEVTHIIDGSWRLPCYVSDVTKTKVIVNVTIFRGVLEQKIVFKKVYNQWRGVIGKGNFKREVFLKPGYSARLPGIDD